MAEQQRILVVEDDRNLAAGLEDAFAGEGFLTDVCHNGSDALERIVENEFDLIVLDVMLPGMSGMEVCQGARKAGVETPVLFLTVKGSPQDRIDGMMSGADDYLTKPFQLEELLLRARAILRRWEWRGNETQSVSNIVFGGNEVDVLRYEATSWDGRRHSLTEKEIEILKVLADQEGNVISRDDLLETVWGDEVFPSTRTVDNFILRLRKRFEPNPQSPVHFHSVRGVGYRLTFTPQPNEDA